MSDEGSPQRYVFVADSLRRRVTAGDYPVGSELPTVTKLAQHFEVSHMTIKKALAILSAEGVIATRRGARTRVAAVPQVHLPLTQQVRDLRDRVDGLDARLAALESHTNQPKPRRRT